MSYSRVIPRDLFNEASLLKMMGRIYILLDKSTFPNATLEECFSEPREPFDIRQNEHDGSIYVYNLALMVRGQRCELERPLNSREPWPLWLNAVDSEPLDEPISVFTSDGEFSPEMVAFLAGEA